MEEPMEVLENKAIKHDASTPVFWTTLTSNKIFIAVAQPHLSETLDYLPRLSIGINYCLGSEIERNRLVM